jgi:hypothetical protein
MASYLKYATNCVNNVCSRAINVTKKAINVTKYALGYKLEIQNGNDTFHYYGEIKNKMPHGKGELYLDDKKTLIFSGEFKDGKYKKGLSWNKEGVFKYQGEFFDDDRFYGNESYKEGILFDKDGIFDGTFIEDKNKEGIFKYKKGILIDTDGKTKLFDGTFIDGKYENGYLYNKDGERAHFESKYHLGSLGSVWWKRFVEIDGHGRYTRYINIFKLWEYVPHANGLNLHESITDSKTIQSLVPVKRNIHLLKLKDLINDKTTLYYKLDKNGTKYIVLKVEEAVGSEREQIFMFNSKYIKLELTSHDIYFDSNLYMIKPWYV